MSELNQKFRNIVKEVEERIQNKEDAEFVKQKISEISILFLDTIDRITEMGEQKMKKIEEKQKDLEEKLNSLDCSLSTIENDIYENDSDDKNYDFEIVCPYCNHEFTCDIEANDNAEVQCPECKNIIELDWNAEEDGCGDCSCCEFDCKNANMEEEQENNQEDDDM